MGCAGCGGPGYCSPRSGRCYDSKKKDYYETCGNASAPEPVAPPVPTPTPPEGTAPASCCTTCSGKGYCSPVSGRCYDWKKRGYYATCFVGPAPCCSSCEGTGFCSTRSGKCYSEKRKAHYEPCSAGIVV